MSRRVAFTLAVGLLAATVSFAESSITVHDVPCLKNQESTRLTAHLDPDLADVSVRLWFRRLNPSGGFYWVEMKPSGDGNYWTTFPMSDTWEQVELFDEWWDILESRDWMQAEDRDRDWLQEFLEEQEHEAMEYRVVVADPHEQVVASSDIFMAPVWDAPTEKNKDDGKPKCENQLEPKEIGFSRNLVIGETSEAQKGQSVFHFSCSGIVSRVGVDGVIRGDEYCRGCAVAAFWAAPVVGGAALVVTRGGGRVTGLEEESPSEIEDGGN